MSIQMQSVDLFMKIVEISRKASDGGREEGEGRLSSLIEETHLLSLSQTHDHWL
jgi:hypothetical protein